MTTQTARLLPAVLLVLCSASGSARADALATVAKARAYLGSDAALNAVKSVHCTGTLITPTNKPAVIDMIFQKPYQQRITATSETNVEITALDNYDGWQRLMDAKDPTRWQFKQLTKDEIKSLRANTWQNLGYYSGFEKAGVKLEDLGEVKVDGVTCQKITFRHTESIVFTRYFDKSSGRLVLTETGQGRVREEGEMMVSGIRFPKKFITSFTGPDGKEYSSTVTFDKITINETFAPSSFAVPMFSTR